jgi:hypothetical protein
VTFIVISQTPNLGIVRSSGAAGYPAPTGNRCHRERHHLKTIWKPSAVMGLAALGDLCARADVHARSVKWQFLNPGSLSDQLPLVRLLDNPPKPFVQQSPCDRIHLRA